MPIDGKIICHQTVDEIRQRYEAWKADPAAEAPGFENVVHWFTTDGQFDEAKAKNLLVNANCQHRVGGLWDPSLSDRLRAYSRPSFKVQEALYAAKVEDDGRSAARAKRVLDAMRPGLNEGIRRVLGENAPEHGTLRWEVSLRPDGTMDSVKVADNLLSTADAGRVRGYLERKFQNLTLGTPTANGVVFDHLFHLRPSELHSSMF